MLRPRVGLVFGVVIENPGKADYDDRDENESGA